MLRKKLPAINGLVTFEAAARRLSFTEAADELCVTQAAVSRQIKRLEDKLGCQLFLRVPSQYLWVNLLKNPLKPSLVGM